MLAKTVRPTDREGDYKLSAKLSMIKNPINAATVHDVFVNDDGSRSTWTESYRPTQADEDADELRRLRVMLDRESRLMAREVTRSNGVASSPYYSKPNYGLVKPSSSSELAWDSSPHRAAPHALRGMTPLPGISQNEPWAPAAMASCTHDHL